MENYKLGWDAKKVNFNVLLNFFRYELQIFQSIRFFFSLVVLAACSPKQEDVKRPNIIFIFSDDHATQAIGAYGPSHNNPGLHEYVQTPNLDQLASEGMIFSNVFCANR